MTPTLRKLALVAHVTCSIGWFGAVAAFLALALAGLWSDDRALARAAYLAMGLTTSYVIVPASVASLLTGLISSLASPLGLFRHYWVIAKLALTSGAVLLLLVHTQPIAILADAAAERALLPGELSELRLQVAVDAAAALIVLLGCTLLGVFKPRGKTRWGRRAQPEGSLDDDGAAAPRWAKALAFGVVAFLLLLKAATGGLGTHGPPHAPPHGARGHGAAAGSP